jgi:hypothetical protein
MYVFIDISNRMLEDSAFDIKGEVRGARPSSPLSRKAPKSPSGPVRSVQRLRTYGALARELSVIG